MERIINDITSLHWWVTVFVAGVFLRIIANYGMRGLDWVFPKLASRFKSWAGDVEAGFERDINRVSEDIQLLTFTAARQTGLHVVAIQYYILSVALYAAAAKINSPVLSNVLWPIGLGFTLMGAHCFGQAMRCKTIVDNALKRPKKSGDALIGSQSSGAQR